MCYKCLQGLSCLEDKEAFDKYLAGFSKKKKKAPYVRLPEQQPEQQQQNQQSQQQEAAVDQAGAAEQLTEAASAVSGALGSLSSLDLVGSSGASSAAGSFVAGVVQREAVPVPAVVVQHRPQPQQPQLDDVLHKLAARRPHQAS